MMLAKLRNLVFRPLSPRSRPRQGRPPRRLPHTRLIVEPLEDRNLLSSSGLTAANVNTDTEGDVHNETTIAVNPTNPLNLIGSSNGYEVVVLGNGQIHFTARPNAHVTFDGGQTWANYPIPLQGYNSVFDPSVSFDADGTAYFAAVARAHSANFQHSAEHDTANDIIVSHSADGGQHWSAPVRVATGTGGTGDRVRERDNDKDYVAAWGAGNAIVVWSQINWGPRGEFIDKPVLASVTHDGGNTWTVPARISGPLGFFAVPAVAADGGVYVAYWSFDEEVAPQFRDHYKVVKVDPATGQPLGPPAEVGLIYDGVNDYPQSIQGAYTYQDSQFTSWPTGNITADPTNALHLAVVWSDMRNNPYPDGVLPSLDPYQVQTNSDIIISQSFDGGVHWSAPTAIATPNDQFQPWGAYDASGRLQIGYYDRSYDPANHKYGYTLASETVPGSLTFTSQQVTTALSDPTQGDAFLPVTVNSNFPNATLGIGDYSGITVTPTGVAALWTDLRLSSPVPAFSGSGEDAFFALVDPPASLTAAGPVADKFSTQTLTQAAVQPILAEAFARWAGAGIDVSALSGIDVRIADLGGTTLSLASGTTIWLDDNAAGWGWFVDPTPADDSEFGTPGDQGEQGRIDLLTVLGHELGHLLGYPDAHSGLMGDTLAAGVRLTPADVDPLFAAP
jgi:hypothetical protein